MSDSPPVIAEQFTDRPADGMEVRARESGEDPGRLPVTRDQGRDLAICLYQLFKFVEWPASDPREAGGPFVLGVVGSGILCNLIERVLSHQTVGDRPVEVRRIASGDGEGMRRCHVVYCESVEHLKSADLASELGAVGVVLASTDEAILDAGGMIRVELEGGSLKVAIQLERARRAGLKVSSKLLSVSRVVEEEP